MATYFSILTSIVLVIYFIYGFTKDIRYARKYEAQGRVKVFHCLKCSSIYTSSGIDDSATCPKCGYKNGRLKF